MASLHTAMLAAIKLLCNQSLVPLQKRIRSHEGSDFFEALAAKGVGEHRKAAALCIGEAEPAPAELGFQDAVFFN